MQFLFFPFFILIQIFLNLANKLIKRSPEHNGNSYSLLIIEFMSIVSNAQCNSKNLPSGDDEGYDVLFELFDDPVDEDLSDEAQNSYEEVVDEDGFVVEDEVEDVGEVAH